MVDVVENQSIVNGLDENVEKFTEGQRNGSTAAQVERIKRDAGVGPRPSPDETPADANRGRAGEDAKAAAAGGTKSGPEGEARGYQGTEAERQQIADALDAISADPLTHSSVASALRAFYGEDTSGAGFRQLSEWYSRCEPDAWPTPRDVGLNGHFLPVVSPKDAWGKAASARPNPTSILPEGAPPTPSELLFELRRLAKENGGPIRTWPDMRVEQPKEEYDKATGRKNEPKVVVVGKSRANVAWFMRRVGVTVYWDDFARDFMVTGLRNYRRLDDHAARALWFKAMALGLHTEQSFFIEAVKDIARADTRNPLKAYLDKVEAEYRARVAKGGEPAPGKALIECLLIWYAGAEDTPLNCAHRVMATTCSE